MSEKMYEIIHEMFEKRIEFWEYRNGRYACAFSDALAIIEYAHENNFEGLSNFDFFPIDKLAEM